MFADVEQKLRKRSKLLFTRESESLAGLRALICEQRHLTLVLWAFECVQVPLSELIAKYPAEAEAIRSAYALCLAWAHGELKMPLAKRGILNCHAMAKKLTDAHDIALCHAIGQGCATVHVETHALGLVMYELTAIVRKCGGMDYQCEVQEKISFYIRKLEWWQANISTYAANENWVDFLSRPDEVNKEKLLLTSSGR